MSNGNAYVAAISKASPSVINISSKKNIETRLFDISPDLVQKGMLTMETMLQKAVAKEKITPENVFGPEAFSPKNMFLRCLRHGKPLGDHFGSFRARCFIAFRRCS